MKPLFYFLITVACQPVEQAHTLESLFQKLNHPDWRTRENSFNKLKSCDISYLYWYIGPAKQRFTDPETRFRLEQLQNWCRREAIQRVQAALDARYSGIYPAIDALIYDTEIKNYNHQMEMAPVVANYLTRGRERQIGLKANYPNYPDYREATRIFVFDLYVSGKSITYIDDLLKQMYDNDVLFLQGTAQDWKQPDWWTDDVTTRRAYSGVPLSPPDRLVWIIRGKSP